MTSVRPYLVRALVDWIADNGQTPHLVVDCSMAGVQAPMERAEKGRLVLNVSAGATRNLLIGDHWLDVDCRFGGEPVHVRSPVGAVVAVYSRESGMGMAFDAEDVADVPPPEPPRPRPGGPKLTIVK
ncbi:MAG: ClpXP protease specificity-enhancing factor SspB [Gammaproteobacteria bacterium]|nr:ClpXP protease specificity-enhancing factor SspB [Gammaproteobacteria bacterium]